MIIEGKATIYPHYIERLAFTVSNDTTLTSKKAKHHDMRWTGSHAALAAVERHDLWGCSLVYSRVIDFIACGRREGVFS